MHATAMETTQNFGYETKGAKAKLSRKIKTWYIMIHDGI